MRLAMICPRCLIRVNNEACKSALCQRDTAIRERDDARSELAKYTNVIVPAWKREELAWEATEARLTQERDEARAESARKVSMSQYSGVCHQLADAKDTIERLTRERDEAIGVLLDCAPDGANAYPVGMEGVYLAAEKINAARVALLQESARRLEIIATALRGANARKIHGLFSGATIRVDPMWNELDAAGLLVEENGVKRVRG